MLYTNIRFQITPKISKHRNLVLAVSLHSKCTVTIIIKWGRKTGLDIKLILKHMLVSNLID